MLGDIAMEGCWSVADLRARLHPDDRPTFDRFHQRLLANELQHAVTQYRVRSSDGWLWVENHAMVAERDAQGRPLRLMGTLADIGERKRAEAKPSRRATWPSRPAAPRASSWPISATKCARR
jgi:hypothetical protein